MTSNLDGHNAGRRFGDPVGEDRDERLGLVVYRDESGADVTDPAQAVSGEILGNAAQGLRRRAWFRIEEVELHWLPVRESAFLLWVLALLAAVWLAIGVVLHFT
jgi:hypothetical protein